MEQQNYQTFELNPHQYEQNDVAQTLTDFSEAIRNGNIHTIMSFYEEEIRAFDMMPPLSINNKLAYQKNWEECFTNFFQFPVNYSYIEPKIEMSGNLAVVHSLIHMSGDSIHGENMDCWLRSTMILKKHGVQWLISHEHNSTPLDPETGKGLMNLSPDGNNEAQMH